MTLDSLRTSIKLAIGEEMFRQACLDAWACAPGTGTRNHPLDTLAMARTFVEFDAQTARAWADASDSEVVEVFCGFYAEMPCYHFLFELLITLPYKDWSKEALDYFWEFTRRMLSSEHDALGDPVAYILWSDFFETDGVSEAWKALIAGDPKPKLIERLLESSGPVPFSLKEALYAKLIDEQRWHHYIFRSIYFSIFDVYGDVDRHKAAMILANLALPPKDKADAQRAWAALNDSNGTTKRPQD